MNNLASVFSLFGTIVCVLVLTSCGSSEETETYSASKRVRTLPAQARLQGAVPSTAQSVMEVFGQTKLVSLSFASRITLDPPFEVAEVQWAKAASTSILQPALNGCELTGMEIYFKGAGATTADIHSWGWDAADTDACERFFEKVRSEGIVWRFGNVPGVYGDTIKQVDFQFK